MTIDVVKCNPVNCSRKDTCLRYTHPPRSRWQAYLTEGVVKLGDADNGKCVFGGWEIMRSLL